MRKRFNVWRVELKWGKMQMELHPIWIYMVIVWTMPPAFGELTWRLFGGEFFGVILGLFLSSLKTFFDYLVVMYEYKIMSDIQRKKYRGI